jgi:hypothetical protein
VLWPAIGHSALMWMLQLVLPCRDTEQDQQILTRLRCQRLPYSRKGTLIMQTQECWSEVKYDAKPAPAAVRLGLGNVNDPFLAPSTFVESLGRWTEVCEDFHWAYEPLPVAMSHFSIGHRMLHTMSGSNLKLARW